MVEPDELHVISLGVAKELASVDQYTSLKVASFCTADEHDKQFPCLKGRGGEVKALLPVMVSVLLPIAAADRLRVQVVAFLRIYQKLAYEAETATGQLVWTMPGKFHWLWHLCMRAKCPPDG